MKRPAQLRIPLAATLKAQGHRFIRDEVLAIDSTERQLQLASGRKISADYLVLAPGGDVADYGIPGVREHALPLRSVDQARAIHSRLNALAKERGGGGPGSALDSSTHKHRKHHYFLGFRCLRIRA